VARLGVFLSWNARQNLSNFLRIHCDLITQIGNETYKIELKVGISFFFIITVSKIFRIQHLG
jgi:hypothetical protein